MRPLTALSGIAAAAAAAPAHAATDLGQVAPAPAVLTCLDATRVQDSASPSNPYVVPAAGVITAWSTRAGVTGDTRMRLKVMRRTAAPADFTVVADSGLETLAAGAVNSFAVRIPVQAGDVLGQRTEGGAACAFTTPSLEDTVRSQSTGILPLTPPPADPGPGETATLSTVSSNYRLNLAAVLEPDADGDGLGDESQDGDHGTGGGAAGPPRDPGSDDPAPSMDPTLAVAPRAGSVRVDRKGRFTVPSSRVLCPKPGSLPCTVRLGVATSKKVRLGATGKKRFLGLAERTFAIKPGGSAPLKARLSKKGLAALRKLGRAKVAALVGAAREGATPGAATIRFVLKAPRNRR